MNNTSGIELSSFIQGLRIATLCSTPGYHGTPLPGLNDVGVSLLQF